MFLPLLKSSKQIQKISTRSILKFYWQCALKDLSETDAIIKIRDILDMHITHLKTKDFLPLVLMCEKGPIHDSSNWKPPKGSSVYSARSSLALARCWWNAPLAYAFATRILPNRPWKIQANLRHACVVSEVDNDIIVLDLTTAKKEFTHGCIPAYSYFWSHPDIDEHNWDLICKDFYTKEAYENNRHKNNFTEDQNTRRKYFMPDTKLIHPPPFEKYFLDILSKLTCYQ